MVGEKGSKSVYKLQARTKTNLTTLIATSADGDYCPLYVVYPGQHASRNLKPLEGAPKEWFFGFSDSGWMNSELFYSWVSNRFHPFLLDHNVHFPVLLLADGNSSHPDYHVGEFCKSHGIILFRLEAHATHVRQPLDLAVFGPLKKLYRREHEAWKDRHPGVLVMKANFCQIFANAWAKL